MPEFRWHTGYTGSTDEIECVDFYHVGSSAGWGEKGKVPERNQTATLVIHFKHQGDAASIKGEDAWRVLEELKSVHFSNIRYHPAVP